MIQREAVQSSNIKSVGYDPATKTLHVEFGNGGLYTYEGMTQEDYDAFRAAPSLGSHLHSHIKPRFACKKI